MEERREGEDLKLSCLLGWLAYWLLGSQGQPAGVGGWDNRMSKRLEKKICVIDRVERGTEWEGLPQMVCYRCGGNGEGLDLKEQSRGDIPQSAYLLSWPWLLKAPREFKNKTLKIEKLYGKKL